MILLICLLGVASSTRINFGSCDHPEYSHDIWKTIVSRNPDLWIWTGDATYLDYNQFDMQSSGYTWNYLVYGINSSDPSTFNDTWRNKSVKTNKYYKQLEQQCPIIGIWDDHDYGINNGNFTYQHKDLTQQLFLDFLNYPKDHLLRQQKGMYSYHQINVEIPIPIDDDIDHDTSGQQDRENVATRNLTLTKVIDIILLDVRYFAGQDGKQDILGDTQWQWFENLLENSNQSDLTLIVSGIQMIPYRTMYGQYVVSYIIN